MLGINDLKTKLVIMIDDAPYQVMEVKHLHMGRGASSVQTSIRNLLTGQLLSRNFKPGDSFTEADIEKRELTFVYTHRDDFIFSPLGKPGERITLKRDELGDVTQWLKPGMSVIAMLLDEKIVQVNVPIKVELKVTEAAVGLRGDTVSGATKEVTLESGAKVHVPLFVREGDIIRVNTETGEYAERVSKGKSD